MPEESRRLGDDPDRAWAPYEPSPRRPWTPARAAHLLRRAGFGPTWPELQRALADGPHRTVDRLLRPGGDLEAFDRAFDGDEAVATAAGPAAPLRAWWLRRMIETPHPLREKMTLFWHDLVAVGAARVPHGALLRRHLGLLRQHALGRVPALLDGLVSDPATLLALGDAASRKARPEEGVARQLLHRLTVGPEACTDGDLRDTARALTGWFVLRGELRYFEREHDGGAKTILGQTGPWTGSDAARIAAAHPATARNLARRLYRWLVSETDAPDDAALAPVARALGPEGDLARAVETILRSECFHDDASIHRRIKRPVELAVGLVRALEGGVPTLRLADDLAALGEDLLHPPTRDGWAGGRHWINPASIVGRANLVAALLDPKGPYGDRLDPAAAAARHGFATPEAAAQFLAALWIQAGPEDVAIASLRRATFAAGGLRAFAHRLAASTAFQLA